MKRKLLYFCGVCLLLLALVGCSSASKTVSLEFVPYEHEDGIFYAKFPGTPEFARETFPSPVGDIQLDLYTIEVKNGYFSIQFSDFPDGTIDPTDTESYLSRYVYGAIGSMDGRVIEEKDYTFEGYPGKEAKYSFSIEDGEYTLYTRLFLVDNRLFQLQIMNGDTDEYLDHYDDFFNSFKLSK